MAYIGRGIDNISQIEVLDLITFTNSAGPYNILKGAVAFIPSTVNSLLIEVDGIIQAPASYTVDGSTITFGVSMPSTSTMNSMIHFGTGLITTPADGSVTAAKIASDAVTTAKILDSNVTTAKLALPLPSIAIDWESKSTSFTAAAGKAYFCDTTGGTISVTLPSPTQKDTIRFLDVAGTFDTNNLTVLYGSSKIQGASANLVVSTERAGFALVYYDATQGWLLTEK
jgi:hypothetical protein